FFAHTDLLKVFFFSLCLLSFLCSHPRPPPHPFSVAFSYVSLLFSKFICPICALIFLFPTFTFILYIIHPHKPDISRVEMPFNMQLQSGGTQASKDIWITKKS